MVTLDATVFPDEAYVLVEADLSSVPNVDCARVTRRNTVTGDVFTLRPYVFYNADGSLILECDQGLWWDTEPPLDVDLEYCVTPCDTHTALSQNPDFEGDITPWTALGGATLTHDCAVAHSGTCSMRITPSGIFEEPGARQTVPMAIRGGVETILSGWLMAPLGWNAVWLQLDVTYTDNSAETFETGIEILDNNEWRFLSVTFTPRLDVVGSPTLSIVIAGIPPAPTLFYADQVQVTQPLPVVGTACETVEVVGEGFWLKNPLSPCLDVAVGICNPMLEDCEDDSRVSFASMPEETYSPNTVLLSPANQEFPIPINRIRRGVESTLRLIAHDCDARDAILAANKPGTPLLWQAPADYCTPDRYMTVGIESELKISVDHREDFRLMTLPHVQVARPPGPANGVCGARIADLCDIYTSWTALGFVGLTWTDLLLGQASPSGPGQPDPPAAARTWDDVEAEFADWDAVEAGGTRDWDELRDGL